MYTRHTLSPLPKCVGQDSLNDHSGLTLFGQWDTLFLNLSVENRYIGYDILHFTYIPIYRDESQKGVPIAQIT